MVFDFFVKLQGIERISNGTSVKRCFCVMNR